MPTEFNNYCQACATVRISLFRVVKSGNINYQPMIYANEMNGSKDGFGYGLIFENLF